MNEEELTQLINHLFNENARIYRAVAEIENSLRVLAVDIYRNNKDLTKIFDFTLGKLVENKEFNLPTSKDMLGIFNEKK